MSNDATAPKPTPPSSQDAAAEAARAPQAPKPGAAGLPKFLRPQEPAAPQPQTQAPGRPVPKPKPKPKQQPPAPVIAVRPIAEPAKMRSRHWRLMASFGIVVLIPMLFIIAYMTIFAQDQYGSTTGFTVRQEEGGAASEILGGLTQIVGGGGGGSDSEILYEFVQSQALVNIVQERLDIRSHYAQNWPYDWVFSIWPDASAEDMLWFWRRIVRISLDSGSGLIELRVLAYDPDMAQQIAQEIVRESQDKINQLNAQARNDAMRYAVDDLNLAVDRLKTAREALTRFRSRTQIVDPEADIQGRMGVMSGLQEQLAAALIEYGLLQETTNPNDPRVQQAVRRIEVIRDQINTERNSLNDNSATGDGEDYPALIAEYESLSVDREFAEETYRAALAALDLARNNAQRQSRYLATYIEPTRAETSEYPQRIGIIAMAAFFLLVSWSIMALVYYSLRDRN